LKLKPEFLNSIITDRWQSVLDAWRPRAGRLVT
jgi:hypothetical protein